MSKRTIIVIGAGVLAGTCVGYLLSGNGPAFQAIMPSTGGHALVAADRIGVSHLFPEALSAHERAAAFDDIAALSEHIVRTAAEPRSNERDASALPLGRARSLRVAAIERMAERDARSAIELALALRPTIARTVALQRVAEAAMRSGPRVALDHAALIPHGPQRVDYTEQVFDTWTTLDPTGVLDYLEQADASEVDISAEGMRRLASAQPERLLAVAGGLRPALRSAAEEAAMDVLISRDPRSAYAYADALPHGGDRDRLLRMAADGHSQLSARDALSHVLALERPPGGAINVALARVAAEDFPYAVEMAGEALASVEMYAVDGSLRMLFSAAFERGTPDIAAAVDLVANHHDHRVRRQLNGIEVTWGILSAWAEQDPEGALAWTLRNPSHVAPDVVELLGSLSAASSPGSAAAVMYDLPAALRGYWMVGVAGGLARSSLEAALQWLEPTRGSPVYQTALESALNGAAATEPAAVAGVIDSMPEARAGLISNVAREWALREPGMAGEWIARVEQIDEDLRTALLRRVVRDWWQRDQDGAEGWAKSLPAGPLRDSALDALVREAANTGLTDVRLLAAYSSDEARAADLVQAMSGLRGSDPELGRWLIDEYISSSELRESARQRLAGHEPRRRVRVVDGVRIADGEVIGD